MRFNYRWLCEYLGFEPPLADLCHTLTMGGIEVEELVDLGAGHGRIVVGEVLEVEPHPNADRLRLATVRWSPEATEAPLKLVCGAPNLARGCKYPLALTGAVLPGGLEIKPTKIRGVESIGMLCSARELAISEDSDGILELPADTPTGRPFDAIIEVKVTPNRPDALSLFGIARDVAALMGKRVSFRRPQVPHAVESTASITSVDVQAPERCPRYMARVVRDVTIGPSPLWMQRRLEAAGLRAINNAVDVTNYVLLELGQPLHAFDLDQLDQHRIVVRMAKPGETIRLLDGTDLALTDDDLVIADGSRPQVLAGVMGGESSEVRPTTRNILLECAYFQPSGVRRASRRHGRSTDSSYRFERGVDRKAVALALDRAAQLLQELCGGHVLRDPIDVHAATPEPRSIKLAYDRVNSFLGTDLRREAIAQALSSLGFSLDEVADDALTVSVPSFRVDIEQDVDLIEEVARVTGYDSIPYTMPAVARLDVPPNASEELARRARHVLVGAGLCEVVSYSFTDPSLLAPFQSGDSPAPIPLVNPLSPELAVMRTSLVPGVLKAVSLNQRRHRDPIALFEIGRIFLAKPGYPPASGHSGSFKPADSIDEVPCLTAALHGPLGASWRTGGKGRPADFHDIKGLASHLLGALRISGWSIERATDVPWLHPGRSARIALGGRPLMLLGQLHPSLGEMFDLRDTEVLLLTAELPPLLEAMPNEVTRAAWAPPQFPPVERALALLLADATPAEACLQVIQRSGGDLLESVRPFDVYRGQGVPEGSKSLAFEMCFRAPDRSLTDEEVNAAIAGIIRALEADTGARVRG